MPAGILPALKLPSACGLRVLRLPSADKTPNPASVYRMSRRRNGESVTPAETPAFGAAAGSERREKTNQRIRAYLGIKYLKNSLQYLSLPIDENVQS